MAFLLDTDTDTDNTTTTLFKRNKLGYTENLKISKAFQIFIMCFSSS